MKPLNFAILKYFTKVDKASTAEVMATLSSEYGAFKAFTKKDILEALLTAEANGLIEGVGSKFDEDNELLLYFRAHEEGKQTINRYIHD
ncbi:MAG: hypothetical protein ACK5MF_13595 [Vibrio sp.]|uniref:hypothetical protein n=1 Tax=Vibrio sp. TaxID=678 RepID=UPI003A87F5EA